MTSLETERLLLRPLSLEDAARASRFSRDWDVARMTASMPFPQPAINVEGLFLIEQARAGLLARDHLFAIDLPGEGLSASAARMRVGVTTKRVPSRSAIGSAGPTGHAATPRKRPKPWRRSPATSPIPCCPP